MNSVHSAIRIDADDHAAIKARAEAHGMPWSRYVIDSALGRLPEQQHQLAERVDELERNVARLQELAYGN